jgi:hypothetical protein
MMITVRCFKVGNEVVCVDDFGENVINLTKREYRARMTICEYEKLLEELQEAGAKEIPVVLTEKHKFDIRTYYRIYRVAVQQYRYKYFMEVFDGSSATYEYVFCNSKKRCLQVMEEREKGNKMFY